MDSFMSGVPVDGRTCIDQHLEHPLMSMFVNVYVALRQHLRHLLPPRITGLVEAVLPLGDIVQLEKV